MFFRSTSLLKYVCMSSQKGLWRTNLNCMRWSRRECELWLDEQEYLMWLITKIQKICFSIQIIDNKMWSAYTETKIHIQFKQTVSLCTSSCTTVLLINYFISAHWNVKDLMVAKKQGWNMFSLACIVINVCGNSFRVFFIIGLSDRHKNMSFFKISKVEDMWKDNSCDLIRQCHSMCRKVLWKSQNIASRSKVFAADPEVYGEIVFVSNQTMSCHIPLDHKLRT